MTTKRLLFSTVAAILLSAYAPTNSDAQIRRRGMTLSPDVTVQDIQDLSAYKVNLVRYQLAWTGPVDTATISEYNVWFEDALD